MHHHGFRDDWIRCNNTGCNSKKAELKAYYYYPTSNVYYDVSRELYFYSIDGGKSWDSVARTSAKEPTTLGNKETIYITSGPVYSQNQEHREKYRGSLFSIANAAANVIDSGASERVVVNKNKRKPAANKSGETETKKKPIKEFFNKIFGKRKKQ